MASTRKLTKALTRPLTRKLTGDELQKLFLEKFKLTLGSELIANGNFSSDTGFTENGGWSIDSNVATHTGGSPSNLVTSVTLEAGCTYTLTIDIITLADSTCNVYSLSGVTYHNFTETGTGQTVTFTSASAHNLAIRTSSTNLVIDNLSVKKHIKQAPFAAFSLRKLGDVSPYACRIRRSSDNTEAQVMFDASDRVSESSGVRNTSMNIVNFSEEFGNPFWTKSGLTMVGGYSDPTGGTNAYKATPSTGSGFHFFHNSSNYTVVSGKTYTYSIHLKADGYNFVTLNAPTGNSKGNSGPRVNLSTGQKDGFYAADHDLQVEQLEDGWYRVSTQYLASETTLRVDHGIFPTNAHAAYAGDGNSGVLFWGAQLEEATNYSNEGTQIINDTFSSNSGWTLNVGAGINSTVAIEDNSLKFNVINNGYVRATKDITYDQNKYYILTATVNGTAGKAMRFRDDSGDFGGLTDGFDPPTGAGGKVSGIVTMTGSPQQVSFTWIPTAQSDEIIIERHSNGDYEFTVDNLLIKEYDPLYQDDFTTDTSWTTSVSGSSTVTIPSNGKALLTVANTNPNYASMSKNITYDEGSRYRVTATINGTSGKTVRFRDTFSLNSSGGAAGGLQANATGTQTEGEVTLNGSDQDISLDFTATSDSDKIIFERSSFSEGTCTIDNLIVQKLVPSTSEYISTPIVSNDGLTFTESTLDDFVGGENHLPKSQDFDDWTQVGGSQTIAENHTNHLGESTASLITTAATGARIEKIISIVAGQTYVASVWVKRYNSSRFEMYVLQGGPSYAPQGYIRANISSSDGSLSTHENHGNTSEITYTDFGGGWYRASFKFTATADDNSAVFRLKPDIVDGDKGTYFFGAQLNKDSLKDYQKTEATPRDGRASIVTLYNAVGGEDAHQATQTDQPLLYHRGLLVRDGTSPAILFTQTQRTNLDLQNLSSLTTGHIFAVLSVTNDPPDGSAAQGSNRLWELGTGFNSHHPFTHASNTSIVYHSFGSDTRKPSLDLSSLNLENKHLLTIKSKTNDWNMRIDGVSKQTASTNTVAFPAAPFIGSDSSVFGGKYSEIILFDSDQDSNIDAIQSDIATFHNITLL